MKETLIYDEAEDKLIVKHEIYTAPIVDEIHAIKRDWDGRGDSSLGYFVGHIPHWVLQDYMNRTGVKYDEILNTDEHVKRILNDPEFKDLRVWEGKY